MEQYFLLKHCQIMLRITGARYFISWDGSHPFIELAKGEFFRLINNNGIQEAQVY